MAIFPGSAIQTSGYNIENSLRFNSGDSTYLSWTPSTAGNRTKWTFSLWIKRSSLSTGGGFLSTNVGNEFINFPSEDGLSVYINGGVANVGTNGSVPTIVFRDPSAWYHLIVVWDTANQITTERLKLYVNGAQIRSEELVNAVYPNQYAVSGINDTIEHSIGRRNNPDGLYFDGYMAEVNFIDGQALDPADFGEVDPVYGNWVPKEYEGTYGTNGFYLPFRNQGSIYDITGDARPSNGAVTRYTSTGSQTFTVPTYISSIVVEMWGAGGGSGGSGPSGGSAAGGGAGSATTFATGSLSAGGGGGGASSGAGLGANGAGGIASNGDVNINGTAGTNNSNQTFGYAAPNGYWNSLVRSRVGNGSAYAGLFAGGGATGSAWYITPNYPVAGSGGSGAYLKKTFAAGALTPGDSIAVVVGTGGTAGAQGGAWTGAAGADGEIRITVDGTTLANDYYPANISLTAGSTYDLMNDVPTLTDADTANFATLNPLDKYTNLALSEGNLKMQNTTLLNGFAGVRATTGVFSGKWYWEVLVGAFQPARNLTTIGVDESTAGTFTVGSSVGSGGIPTSYVYYMINGNKRNNGTNSAYGATYTTGDVIGVALDLDNGTLAFYKNGVSQGTAFTGLSGTFSPSAAVYSDTVNGTYTANNTFNFGQRPFAYTPPTGFKKLNTYNLPDPAVKPKENFNVVTYSGSSSSRNITGIGFQPDLVWAKDRTNVVHHTWTDSVRGAPLDLFSSSQSLESNDTNGLTSFNADGFSLGTSTNHNVSGHTYVAWNWKANEGTTAANEDGSISSTVSVNADAGFSIVSFTSPSSGSFTMGHGLGASPDLIIMKRRASTANWGIFHSAVCTSEDNYFIFNTNALLSYTDYWGTALPTSTVFGANVGASAIANEAMIAYCFRSVEGYSSFGKYTGNGSTDGPFIYTGFRPAYVMIKCSSVIENWAIKDTARVPYNPNNTQLFANIANAENTNDTYHMIDFNSNGFKIRGADQDLVNGNGETYIYMAFAENPFKYANARGTSFDKYADPTQAALTIPQSARFDASSTAYLSRTPASAGNQKTWTWSGWVKRSNIDDNGLVFGARTGAGASYFNLVFNPAGDLRIASNLETSYPLYKTNALFRDPSAWYHIVVALDMTQATSTNRLKVYINGVLQTTASYNVPAQNTNLNVNSTATHLMGQQASGQYLDGYLAEVNFIDGQALGPESFGYQDTTTKQWLPRTYDDFGPETDYGSNGFRLDFQSGALGNDVSGNNHDWTLNNMSTTTDVVLDSPSDNYATLNPLNDPRTYVTYSNANLSAINTSATLHSPFIGTIGMAPNSGKYYWEVIGVGDANTRNATGIGTAASMSTTTVWGLVAGQAGFFIGGAGRIYFENQGASSVFDVAWVSGNVIQYAYDANTGKFWAGQNNVWYNATGGTTGDPATGANPTVTLSNADTWFAGGTVFNQGVNSYLNYNFGQESFSHTAPTGFNKLSTTNLPDSTIKDGSDYFTPVLYSGNGGTQSINGVGFSPDLVWIKERSSASGHSLFDTLRGAGQYLGSHSTSEENTSSTQLTSFDTDGFTTGLSGGTNQSGQTYVAWNWKANGSGVSNTDGTIPSTVSVNTTSGFSVVTFAGNASGSATVGHGLGTAPSMVIVKRRDVADGWPVYHSSLGVSKLLELHGNAAEQVSSNYWGSAITSTTFGLSAGGSNNRSGSSNVAYCFAEVPGYSAFGSYEGNANNDGPFIYTGFRPAFLIVKSVDSTSDWLLMDSKRIGFNPENEYMEVNNANAEGTVNTVDFVSNGFKLRDRTADPNVAETYIYMAFAENPFKNSNAR